jgi:glycosyltransferase involved in cell wall biosynthesis
MDISVLIPTRARPDKLARCLESLGAHDNVEIIVGIDEDDDLVGEYAGIGASCKLIFDTAPREPTLGALVNRLAKRAGGDYLFFLGDDYVVQQPDWPQRILDAAQHLPNGVGVLYPRCPFHPKFASLPIISRQTYEALGQFSTDLFPYWFLDTWLDEIGEMLGQKTEVDLDCVPPEGKGDTHGLVDIKFWAQIFESLRPQRVEQAKKLASLAYSDPKRLKFALDTIDWRIQQCAARVVHLQNPEFIAQWEKRSDEKPSPRYLEAKTRAKELLGEATVDKHRQWGKANRTRVMIGLPNTGHVHSPTALNMAGLMALAFSKDVAIGILDNQSSVITMSRNYIVKRALAMNADYILWIDSDMGFPPDTALRLLAHDKDIVGATYNQRVKPYRTLGRAKRLPNETPEITSRRAHAGGLVEMEEMPGGMMLIRTDVYRRVPWPWYFETYYRPEAMKGFRDMLRDYAQVPMPRDLEERMMSVPGFKDWLAQEHAHEGQLGAEYISEDINFCIKAKRYGYRLWCDLNLTWEVVHIGTHEVTCVQPPPAPDVPAEAAE